MREVGLSEVVVAQIESALRVVPIVSVQNRLQHRPTECRRRAGLLRSSTRSGSSRGFPLGSGKLSRGRAAHSTTIATGTGATVSQVSLAWLLRRSPVMVPIPGTSSLVHLEENCAAARSSL